MWRLAVCLLFDGKTPERLLHVRGEVRRGIVGSIHQTNQERRHSTDILTHITSLCIDLFIIIHWTTLFTVDVCYVVAETCTISSFHVSSSGRDHYISQRSPGETQPDFATDSEVSLIWKWTSKFFGRKNVSQKLPIFWWFQDDIATEANGTKQVTDDEKP